MNFVLLLNKYLVKSKINLPMHLCFLKILNYLWTISTYSHVCICMS